MFPSPGSLGQDALWLDLRVGKLHNGISGEMRTTLIMLYLLTPFLIYTHFECLSVQSLNHI